MSDNLHFSAPPAAVAFHRAAVARCRGLRNIGILGFLLALACLAATGRSYHVFRSALLILGLAASSAFAGYMHRSVLYWKSPFERKE